MALGHVTFLFMLYAQGILPFLMPLAIRLMEPPGWRRKAITALTVLGAFVCVWMIYGLIFFESQCFVEQHSIAYRNPFTGNFPVSIMYVIATCGAMLLSTHRVIRIYGVINVVGVTIAHLVKAYAFASVWCFYAATLSVVIYWQFSSRNINVAAPNDVSPILRPFVLPWLRLTCAAGRGGPEANL